MGIFAKKVKSSIEIPLLAIAIWEALKLVVNDFYDYFVVITPEDNT